ncbi:unnamed protein product [Cylindrotheca closterium]|uniref:DUF6824 domain-containing protein n=1 Tax=Cylindrotheca closterium TaxID=2856 RepID=A0AAD2FH45_9STRA|nr:unnamed protein product [Cylindrotheca closterium]
MISTQRRQDNNLIWHEMRQTEQLLASEFNKLSVEERSEALDDIHCVGEELQENSDSIGRLLVEFEAFVEQERNAFYDMAVKKNRAYVEDASFQLRFLRYNKYNVHQSVCQMMKFLEHKAKIFGKDKVSREITLQDLNDTAKELLVSGLYHIQKDRDQSGRVILYMMSDKLGRCSADTMIQVAYYMYNNILLPLPEVQTKGVVGVYYDVTKPGEKAEMPGITFLLALMGAIASFPMRYSALHVCLKPKGSSLALSNSFLHYTLNLTSTHTRTRTRIHYGTDMELQYTLRRHGIPTENTFPVEIDGKIRKNILNAWFQKHEAEIRLNQWIENQPKPQDVLLGKGYRVQNHPGNALFRNFLLSHRDEYDRAPRSLRQKISIRLTQTFVEKGTRFLKQDENGDWREVGHEEAEKKVGQLFRTFRKNNAAQEVTS